MDRNFVVAFHKTIGLYQSNNWTDNWDYRRFGTIQRISSLGRIKSIVKAVLEKIGLRKNGVRTTILAHRDDFQWLYDRLGDDESRQILIDVLAYRVLGHRKVKLPLNTQQYWDKLDALECREDASAAIDLGYMGWKLDCYDLTEEGYPIRVYARAPGVFTQMILQQYRCKTPGHVIEVMAGDTVIDAGGCFGDTALYFAHKAGEAGRVFSFEFMPDNLKLFNHNLELNPALAKRIEIVPNPVWSTSGERLFVEGIGPGAHITPIPKDHDAKPVQTLKIDELVSSKQLKRVDLIKMDIEGAELEALNGAEKTIRSYRPKLAISVYHKLSDFWTIAQWIEGLDVGYRFYLRHFTIHAEETVLFADIPRK